ncbi:unnamed protein product [Orchesella dallaii]|uniref:Uncharacterized protein n=1 Tax=Orchesella dallaii TaxID=48710 RepID=A0ABP1RJR3_9HEXA
MYLLMVIGMIVIGINIVYLTSSDDFCAALNSLGAFSEFIESENFGGSAKKRHQHLRDQLSMAKIKSQLPGLVAIATVIHSSVSPLFLTLAATFFNLDPFYWLVLQVETYFELGFPAETWDIVFGVRAVVCYAALTEIHRTMAVITLILVYETPIFFKCLSYCNSLPLNWRTLQAYNTLRKARYMNIQSCGKICGVTLGGCYFLLVVGNAMIFFGYRMLPPVIYVIMIICTILFDLIIHMYLPQVTKIYDDSMHMIKGWGSMTSHIDSHAEKKWIRVMLKAMKPIYFSCGSVGALKKETKLIERALHLQASISKYTCVPSVIYWDIHTREWKYRRGTEWITLPWLFLGIIMGGLGIVLYLYHLLNCLSSSCLIPTYSQYVFYLFMVIAMMCVGINLVFFKSADDFCASLNSLKAFAKYIELQNSVKNPSERRRTGWRQMHFSELISKLPGIIAISTVLHCSASPGPLIVVGMWFNLDPFYWLMLQFENWVEIDFPAEIWNMMLGLRVIMGYIILTEVHRTLATITLVLVYESPLYFQCLAYCSSLPLGWESLQAYNTLRKVRYMNFESCTLITGVPLGCCYLLLVFANAMILFGWGVLPPVMYVILVMGALLFDLIIHLYLPQVTKVYDDSMNMIENWKSKVSNIDSSKERKWIRAMLGAMRPISFSCGSVGQLKKETKIDYFKSIFDGFFDVILAFNTK